MALAALLARACSLTRKPQWIVAWVAEPLSKWGGTSARQKNIEHFRDLNYNCNVTSIKI